MKLLIATPCYNGELNTRYFQSFLATMAVLSQKGIEMNIVTMDRDALISRARNACATAAMEMGYDRILFIDNDIVWTPNQVEMLLQSDKQIIGGTYPYKSLPIKINFSPLPDHIEDFNNKKNTPQDYVAYSKKYADPKTGEVEVFYLPAGFLLIDTYVFKRLTHVRPKYSSWDAPTQSKKFFYDFFPIQVLKIPDTDVYAYETEDWGFCSVASEAGFKIYLQTKCVVDHLGQMQFSMWGNGNKNSDR